MFDYCLYFNSTALARLAEREWSGAFRRFELTPSQAFLLRLVLDQPGLLQRELAMALTISRPTATRLLHGLEEKRLVERRSSSTDGREWRIFPTPAAERIKAQLNAASAEVTRRIKQIIGKDVFDETVAKLRGVRAALG
jgi:DNA-binding MarR family transcriptional regulator